MNSNRPDWHEYYLNVAQAISLRGECLRRKVGAVIVSGHTIIATGYNGAPAGQISCLDGGCPRAKMLNVTPLQNYAETNCSVIHAELNAIIRAGRDRCIGSTIYITCEPCQMCRPLIAAAGISKIIYKDDLFTEGVCIQL